VTVQKALRAGPLRIGDIEFDCAVLNDVDRTRVISETRFMEAMGMYRSGALSTRRESKEGEQRIPLSLAYKNLKPFIDQHPEVLNLQPVRYRTMHGNLATVGLPATIIPKVCEVWIDADRAGALKHFPRQKRIAARADILLRGFAHVGIIALVDEATGYQELRDRQTLQGILDKYLLAEQAKWAKRFPDDFYREMFRLRGWQWRGMKVNRPQVVGRYTNDLVWERLAPGLLEELRNRNPKDEKGNRRGKFHQWLTDEIGHPQLQQHIYAILGLMRASTGWPQFVRLVERAFPKVNTNLMLPFPEEED
jgi:P63C domain